MCKSRLMQVRWLANPSKVYEVIILGWTCLTGSPQIQGCWVADSPQLCLRVGGMFSSCYTAHDVPVNGDATLCVWMTGTELSSLRVPSRSP